MTATSLFSSPSFPIQQYSQTHLYAFKNDGKKCSLICIPISFASVYYYTILFNFHSNICMFSSFLMCFSQISMWSCEWREVCFCCGRVRKNKHFLPNCAFLPFWYATHKTEEAIRRFKQLTFFFMDTVITPFPRLSGLCAQLLLW